MAAGSASAWGWLPGGGAWLTVLLAVGSAGLGFLILTTVAFWDAGGCLGGRSRPGVTGRLSGIRVFGLTWGGGTFARSDGHTGGAMMGAGRGSPEHSQDPGGQSTDTGVTWPRDVARQR